AISLSFASLRKLSGRLRIAAQLGSDGVYHSTKFPLVDKTVDSSLRNVRSRSPVRDILPENRHDPEQSASSRAEGERERQTERSEQVRPATVHHALLRITHHGQHSVQKQGRPVPIQCSGPVRTAESNLQSAIRNPRSCRPRIRDNGANVSATRLLCTN